MKYSLFFAALVAAIVGTSSIPAQAVTCQPGGLVITDLTLGPQYLEPNPGATPQPLAAIASAVDVEPVGTDIIWTAGTTIRRYNCASNMSATIGAATGSRIGFDPINNRIYGWIGSNQVAIYDGTTGGSIGTIMGASSACGNDIAVGPDACLICSQGTTSTRVAVPGLCASSGSISTFVSGANQSAAKVPGGTVTYIADSGNNCTVSVPSDSCLGGVTVPGANGVAVDGDSGELYVVAFPDPGMGPVPTIYRQDTANGTLTEIYSDPTLVTLDTPGRMVVLGAVCGDAIIGGSEECDPGADLPNDCCKADCTYEGAGTTCDDALFCNDGETCDAIGACVGGEEHACDDGNDCNVEGCDEPSDSCLVTGFTSNGTACDNDSDLCTLDTCNGGGACNSGPVNPCNDGDACTANSCTPSTGACSNPGQFLTSGMEITVSDAKIQVSDAPAVNGKDMLQVTIKTGMILDFGEASGDMGDPVGGSTSYQFCGFDEPAASSLVRFFSANMPPGNLCKGKPCCKIKGKTGAEKGFICKDPDHEHSAISKFSMTLTPSGTTISFVAQKQDFQHLIAFSAVELMSQNQALHFNLCGSNGTCGLVTFTPGAVKNVFQANKQKGQFKDQL